MSKTLFYIEKEALDYPKTKELMRRYEDKEVIYIDCYADIFNRRNQDFKKQKSSNTFILAVKKLKFIQKNPEYCVSHIKESYYFSTSLNCIFDCEYCFLQWMYSSSYIVLFVNIEDFKSNINWLIDGKNEVMFFSGYDNDSLAIDNVTNFSSDFIPWFWEKKNAYLELRTKSSNISELKKLQVVANVFIAFTLSPEEIQKKYEKKTASLGQRVKAIVKLQKLWWKVAIRIEPVIYSQDYKEIYWKFFKFLKNEINFSKVENIYFWTFKIPDRFFKKIKKMHPTSKLFNRSLCLWNSDQMTYKNELNKQMEEFVYKFACDLIGKGKVFYSNES